MNHSLSYWIGTVCTLSVLTGMSSAQRSALAQSAVERAPHAAGDVESERETIWTCPMHPQIRLAESGKCPICAMNLIAVGEKATDGIPRLVGLQEMLAVGLKHNPEVRAAEARVQAAVAELDRTRFDVLQQIMAYREKWQNHKNALHASIEELRAAEATAETSNDAMRPQANRMAANASEKYSLLRAKLAEIEAELPFLLGRAPGTTVMEPDAASRKLIREDLIPKARQILELRTREYTTGNASILEVAAAHREVTEFETQLAATNQQKIAAIESQKQLLQSTRSITEQLYKAGQASQGDVLAVDLELPKLELRLLELKGE